MKLSLNSLRYLCLFALCGNLISTAALAEEPAKAPAAPVAAAPAPATPPPAVEATTEPAPPTEEGGIIRQITQPFTYEKSDRRDPFQLPVLQGKPLEPGPIFGPLLELQELTLDEIKIRGIILDPVKPRALISFQNYTGKEEIVKIGIGDHIGENFGQVQAIRDGKIIIVQTLEERGRKYTTTRVLSVRK